MRHTRCLGRLLSVHSDLPVHCPVSSPFAEGQQSHRRTNLLSALGHVATAHLQNPAKLLLFPAFLSHQKNWGLREKVRKGEIAAWEVLREKQEEEERVGWRWENSILSIFAAVEWFTEESFACGYSRVEPGGNWASSCLYSQKNLLH